MHNIGIKSLLFLILLFSVRIYSQETFKVIKLEGTVKVQSAANKTWKSLSSGDEVSDNDIIETFFKSNVTLQYSKENLVILGPNSKMLANLKEAPEGSTNNSEASFTLFNGGALIKTVENDPAIVYTSNGVAEIDSGTVTTVVESKTGHTGFQTLGGKASIRNISEQKKMNLSLGMTSIILSGKAPTAPLYITYRHVAVLKHFFGEEYVDRQIERAGIKPTEDASSGSQLSLSDNLKDKTAADGYMHKRLFSQDRIWGQILEEENKPKVGKLAEEYLPIYKPHRIMNTKTELYFRSTIGLLAGTTYPIFQLVPTFHLKKFSMGFNLPLAKNSTQKMSFNANSAEGIFEKINHITLGSIENKKYFRIGAIENYTLGRGLIVKDFKNKNDYAVTQPLGIDIQAKNDKANFQAFIASMTHWRVGGVHVDFYPGDSWISLGFTFDADQYSNTLTDKNSRFIPDTAFTGFSATSPTKESRKANANILDIGIGRKFDVNKDTYLGLYMQFASKFGEKTTNSGYLFKGPEFELNFKQFKFGLSYVQQNGKILYQHFGNSYMSNRVLPWGTSGDTLKVTTYDHLNDIFIKDSLEYKLYTEDNEVDTIIKGVFKKNDRQSYGLAYSIKTSIVKGINIEFDLQHDFLNRHHFKDTLIFKRDTTTIKLPVTTTIKYPKINYSYKFSILIDENLTKFIKHSEIFIGQENGFYLPSEGALFGTWTFKAGFNILTAPLIFNLAIDAGYTFSYLDVGDNSGTIGILDNGIGPNDKLSEFYLGIRWGISRKSRRLL